MTNQKRQDEEAPRMTGKKIVLALLLLAFTGIVVYHAGPVTMEEQVSLHTGERHIVQTHFGITLEERYEARAGMDWVMEKTELPREEQRWIVQRREHSAFWGFSRGNKMGSPAIEVALSTLDTIGDVAAKRPEKAEKALVEYATLVAELDVAEYEQTAEENRPVMPVATVKADGPPRQVNPQRDRILAMANMRTTPLAEFHQDLKKQSRHY